MEIRAVMNKEVTQAFPNPDRVRPLEWDSQDYFGLLDTGLTGVIATYRVMEKDT